MTFKVDFKFTSLTTCCTTSHISRDLCVNGCSVVTFSCMNQNQPHRRSISMTTPTDSLPSSLLAHPEICVTFCRYAPRLTRSAALRDLERLCLRTTAVCQEPLCCQNSAQNTLTTLASRQLKILVWSEAILVLISSFKSLLLLSYLPLTAFSEASTKRY